MELLPTTSSASAYTYTVTLESESIVMRFRYMVLSDKWVMSMERDGVPILTGQRVVMGTDMLSAHNFNLGSLFVFDPRLTGIIGEHSNEHAFGAALDPGKDPGRNDLGDIVFLIYATEADKLAAVST